MFWSSSPVFTYSPVSLRELHIHMWTSIFISCVCSAIIYTVFVPRRNLMNDPIWSNALVICCCFSKSNQANVCLSCRLTCQRTTLNVLLSNRRHCGHLETSHGTWGQRWFEPLSQPGHLSRDWLSVEMWSERSHRWVCVCVCRVHSEH